MAGNGLASRPIAAKAQLPQLPDAWTVAEPVCACVQQLTRRPPASASPFAGFPTVPETAVSLTGDFRGGVLGIHPRLSVGPAFLALPRFCKHSFSVVNTLLLLMARYRFLVSALYFSLIHSWSFLDSAGTISRVPDVRC